MMMPDAATTPAPDPAAMSAALPPTEAPPSEAAATPYSDDRALVDFYTQFRDDCLEDRLNVERDWTKKLWYLIDRQWISDERKRGQWQDKRLVKWMPKPVTNLVAETKDVYCAVFESVQLGITARPAGDNPDDQATAELADALEPCLVAEHGMRAVMRLADFWLAILHNVFLYTWWDKRADTNGSIVIPFEQCATCQTTMTAEQLTASPTCTTCGGTAFQKATHPDGSPNGATRVIGRGRTDAVSPLELLVPAAYPQFDDVPGVIRRRWRTKRWWQANHPELAKTLTFSAAPSSQSMQLLRNLATASGIAGAQTSGGGGSGAGTEGAIEDEVWLKPCPQFPEGLFMRVVGDSSTPQIVRDAQEGTPGPLPATTADGRRLFPWAMIRWAPFGGRLWARGPMDGLLPIQDRLNRIDAFIELCFSRTANPIWLKPKGAEVQAFTGEPGLVVEWNPLAAGATGAKPERIPGENIPGSILALRKLILDDAERQTGANDPLKGNKPAGVEAFSAMQLLVERSQSRMSTTLAERGEGYRTWYALALELERQYGPEERLWTVLGPNRKWTIETFKRANLHGAVDILVEDGTQAPKTSLGIRAAIEHANQMGFIKKDDPEQRDQIFRALGLTRLQPTHDANVTAALQEQQAFEAFIAAEAPGGAAANPMQVRAWQDDTIHLSEHRKWANGDAVRDMLAKFPGLDKLLTEHLEAHEQAAMLKEMPPAQRAQFAAQQAGMNVPGAIPGQQPTPGQPQGGGRAMRNSNQESGPLPMTDRPPNQPMTPGVM